MRKHNHKKWVEKHNKVAAKSYRNEVNRRKHYHGERNKNKNIWKTKGCSIIVFKLSLWKGYPHTVHVYEDEGASYTVLLMQLPYVSKILVKPRSSQVRKQTLPRQRMQWMWQMLNDNHTWVLLTYCLFMVKRCFECFADIPPMQNEKVVAGEKQTLPLERTE